MNITQDQLPALILATIHGTPKLFVAYNIDKRYEHDRLLYLKDGANDRICEATEAILVTPNIDTLYPEALL